MCKVAFLLYFQGCVLGDLCQGQPMCHGPVHEINHPDREGKAIIDSRKVLSVNLLSASGGREQCRREKELCDLLTCVLVRQT